MTRPHTFALAPLVLATLVGSAWMSTRSTLAPGFGATALTGIAGGTVRAIRFGNTSDGFCKGWIASSPNHVIVLTRDLRSMTMRASAPSDTTLVVLGPNGTRCNDDGPDGPNPQISGAWAAGEYRVFIGTYDEGQSIRYTLELSE